MTPLKPGVWSGESGKRRLLAFVKSMIPGATSVELTPDGSIMVEVRGEKIDLRSLTGDE